MCSIILFALPGGGDLLEVSSPVCALSLSSSSPSRALRLQTAAALTGALHNFVRALLAQQWTQEAHSWRVGIRVECAFSSRDSIVCVCLSLSMNDHLTWRTH